MALTVSNSINGTTNAFLVQIQPPRQHLLQPHQLHQQRHNRAQQIPWKSPFQVNVLASKARHGMVVSVSSQVHQVFAIRILVVTIHTSQLVAVMGQMAGGVALSRAPRGSMNFHQRAGGKYRLANRRLRVRFPTEHSLTCNFAMETHTGIVGKMIPA